MGHVIAVSGKGGVGKTTLCGLLIQYLCESGKRPVLAVDADANANLNEVLGVEPEVTLGELREEIERAGIDPRYQIPSGMTKQAYLEMRLSDAIAEEDDYDLMVMGRTQGQGCYCFVNGLVQTQVQKLQSHYPYIVVDNEAGMEHISRGKFVCNLKKYRVAQELTQEQLADIVGVRRETIMRLEKAQYNPSLKLAIDISRAVKAPIEDIFIFE